MAAASATFDRSELRSTSGPEATAPLDDARRQVLVLEHLPQVQIIARRIHVRLPSQVRFEDLVHAGILGLLDAMGRYDPQKNVPLKQYAQFRIRGAILDSLRQADWSPRSLRRQTRRLQQAALDCKARLGRDPTDPELASAIGVSLTGLRQLLVEIRGLHLTSLESLKKEPGTGYDGPPSPPRTADENPYQSLLRSEMVGLLARAVGEMPQRERVVLELYHFKGFTMRKIGAVLGIGESRVSQIHTTALPRLRARLLEMLRPRHSGVPTLGDLPSARSGPAAHAPPKAESRPTENTHQNLQGLPN